MQCAHCPSGRMYLRRYEGSREIWACDTCGTETPLLDCERCERRRVRRLPSDKSAAFAEITRGEGLEMWACADCRVTKWRCPRCRRGWLQSPMDQYCDRCR